MNANAANCVNAMNAAGGANASTRASTRTSTSASSNKTPHESMPDFMHNLRGVLRINEPMARHTSWRVGGVADYFYTPADRDDVVQLLRQLPRTMPLYWIGLGSNLLVRDGGIAGMVLCTAKGLAQLTFLPRHRLYADAGVSCAKIARNAGARALSGAEFLGGVPGSFGGALAMNAGAFGGETWQLVEQIECVTRDAECKIFAADEITAGYRNVELPESHWLLGARLQLAPAEADGGAVRRRAREMLHKRNTSQPVQSKNAGSVFRNPPGQHAARLMENAGLKGKQIGDAVVSETHANFIINRGRARAADIEQLIELARHQVHRQCGVELTPEVRIVGRRG